MTTTVTRHMGRLPGSRIGASILVAACEAVGIQPDLPGVRLLGFRFYGEPRGEDGWPNVEFRLEVRRPRWCA